MSGRSFTNESVSLSQMYRWSCVRYRREVCLDSSPSSSSFPWQMTADTQYTTADSRFLERNVHILLNILLRPCVRVHKNMDINTCVLEHTCYGHPHVSHKNITLAHNYVHTVTHKLEVGALPTILWTYIPTLIDLHMTSPCPPCPAYQHIPRPHRKVHSAPTCVPILSHA